jgi:adenosylcobalamin-dependent ribonucleoside-triphosphate reductase
MFSFHLNDEFVSSYNDRTVPWGYTDAGGNSVGEITFMRTYSRLKEDGSKETWVDVCRRVIEGMYSIQKDHCWSNRLPWNGVQAQASAQEAFDRLFNLKWTPPGRGLWMMGTEYVMEKKNSAALQNCAFVSTDSMTKSNPAKPFRFLMEASMLGIGVGFDTKGKDKGFTVHKPTEKTYEVKISDTREGWRDSTADLINSYLKADLPTMVFDYSEIREAGLPIKGFGGTSSGPAPLIKLHTQLVELFESRIGDSVDSILITDIANLIGVCVVSGNVRRSAELALGQPNDVDFINAKNAEAFPVRNSYDPEKPGWGWMSNNSLEATVGMDYTPFVENIALNGEPGFIWLDVSRKYGRLNDPINNKDYRVSGYNPCAEQSLESFECCTLVETYINRHESLEDYKRTLKFAYLYAKTVTLIPTHWEETNAIMQRNRRIGCSVSGLAAFADVKGLPVLREWLDKGYETVQKWDTMYSEWLCVRESVKTTTVKPSGTVSILAGETPGVHWPVGGEYVLRSIRFSKIDPMVPLFEKAGYLVEDSITDPDNTVVVYFPIKSVPVRPEGQVSIFEKANLAAFAQQYWSDNSVSVTLSFDKETESKHVGTILHMYEGRLKTVSFLPQGKDVYPQQPYTEISKDEYDAYIGKLKRISLKTIYNSKSAVDAVGEAYCTTDACEIPVPAK